MNQRIARWAFFIVFILTIFFGYFIKDLKFNYVFEDFFPVDDPDLAYYQKFKAMFDNDNDYLLIGLVHQPTIFDSTFINQVDSLTHQLARIEHVSYVNSITNLKRPAITPIGFFQIPLLHTDQPQRYTQDSVLIYKNEQLVESVVSKDGNATALLLKHDFLTSKEQADSLVNAVENTLNTFNFSKTYIAGKIYAQGIFIEKMQTELMIFLSASIVLVILFLALAYRSWWGIVIPLLVVLIATVWILGFMGLFDKPLDILMVLLPTIMFVVGMSDVVHIMTKYIEQLRMGMPKLEAIKVTFKEVGIATFLTSLTTAVGFLTLLTASITPIRQFGLYTAIGVFMAFFVAFALLPSCLIFLKTPKISQKILNRSAWFGTLSRTFIFILRKRYLINTITIIATAIAIYGVSEIVINTYLIEDLPEDAPLKQSFTFFDNHFGGSRPFEITATVDQKHEVFEPKVLDEIQQVETYLRDSFEAGNVISPVTMVKALNQATHGGATTYYSLPQSPNEWQQVNKYIDRVNNAKYSFQLTAKDNHVGRISARVGDIGSHLSLQRTADLKQFIASHTDSSLVNFKVTGTSNLIDKNNKYLAMNMFEGLAIAFAVVALIAGSMFRSLRMILIALIPNIIPLIIVAGIMGVFGITLKLSTSIIFTIAFGIAVDDTIHFMSKFKIELQKGKSKLYALKRTYLSTGKAIIVTSIILSGGFLTLLLSSFGGTFYTGLLVGLTLVFALLIDLTLLPILILYFYRSK